MSVEERTRGLRWIGDPVGSIESDGRLRWARFSAGVSVVESPHGTFIVHGAIDAHYAGRCGGPRGSLGAPLTDELEAGDGVGRVSEFENGSIVWSPVTGAHEVHGDIRRAWLAGGGARGPLGYPVTDELEIDTGDPANVRRYQFFAHGSLRWSPQTGTTVGCWPERLFGIADTHAHPAAHLGFGHIFHGGVEGALSSCEPTHGVAGTGLSAAGIVATGLVVGAVPISAIALPVLAPVIVAAGGVRAVIITAMEESFGHRTEGHAKYDGWPTWRSRLHQQIHLDWLRRAYDYGQRLIVSLAVGHELISGAAGDFQSDMEAALEQTRFVDELAQRHSDWMAVARDPRQAREIIASNRLAIILGAEVDFLGEFRVGQTPSQADIDALVNQVFNAGIRYIFPIHLSDNAFGGMAIYNDMFTLASTFLNRQAPATAASAELGGEPANVEGLTPSGLSLIGALMARGMLIDIDHMSWRATDEALALAETQQYPLVSGHATFHDLAAPHGTDEHSHANESRKTAAVLARLHRLGSFVGVQPVPEENVDTADTAGRLNNDCPGSSTTFARALLYASAQMDGRVAIGTDLNGLARTSTPRFGPGAARALHADPARRRAVANAQTNGVRYAGPIRDASRERLDPGEHYLTEDERFAWRALLLWESGGPHDFAEFGLTPWQGILEGLRLASRPSGGDHLVGWVAKSGEPIEGLPPDKQPFARTMRATIERWNATRGPNPPLTRHYAGTHDFDYNLEGLAHYGMLPDFFADVANHGLGWDADLLPLLRSAETVIGTWEKCTGDRPRGPERAPRDARTIVPPPERRVVLPDHVRIDPAQLRRRP